MEKSFAKFDPVSTPLLPGINLIEASAGTGKTYAIAMLVLRFVVEQQLEIQEILVVTFTKAATEELKERIRRRLQEARQILLSGQVAEDDNLRQWMAGLDIEPAQIIQRLNLALLDIDRANIFTIHGFCQRILSEHALQSGQLFDSELTDDLSAIKQACADDFWRQQIYPRSAWEAALLTIDYQTPEQLRASVDFIAADVKVLPDYEDLEQNLADLRRQVESQKPAILLALDILNASLSDGKFKKIFSDGFHANRQAWVNWLEQKTSHAPEFSMFTAAGLLGALNGNKFRTSQKNPESSEQQKTAYIQTLGIDAAAFADIQAAVTRLKLTFRRALLHTLREQVDKRLEQLNVLSFDHLISRLDAVLRAEHGQALCHEIRQCYQVALIDEFQDTDESQWFIISTLFHSRQQYLYLIGDPKQAIYKFRGADIHSYFTAQQQAEHCFTLTQNWRSHPGLVSGINSLFSKPKPFYCEQLDFHPVQSARTSAQGEINYQGKHVPPLVIWQLENSESAYWTAGKASVEIQQGVVHEIRHLLSPDFVIRKDDQNSVRTILSKDIAILVRSHVQAQAYQQALNESGITAVINSKVSVFSSAEATDLYILLQAIAQPTHSSLIKQALALTWFNLDGQQLFNIINNEFAYATWVSRFQDYQLDWQNKGLMAMMRRVMTQEKIATQLTKVPHSERRITNLQHVTELLQQAVIEEHLGINKTIDWLAKHIASADSNTAAEALQLRLESDEDAVKIMTMHSAKGLEFPIVFCPYLWQRGTGLKKEKQVIKCYKDQHMIADLGTDQFEEHRSLALDEELAEDIRVFYVAVTRAQYRCYINWADVRTQDKANDSAMAYLLACTEDGFLAQQARLKAYGIAQPEVFEYRVLVREQTPSRSLQRPVDSAQFVAKHRQRSLYTEWQMSSYTSLSALSLHDAVEIPEIPTDKAREQRIVSVADIAQNELPRGAHTGNVIHDLLENIPFCRLAENNDISVQRDYSCVRYGLKTEAPEQLDQLLMHTVSTYLTTDDASFNLQQLKEHQCLKEMPFYLPVKSFDVSRINAILEDCPTYQPLSKKTISGYLTGFVDLICEYQGKYYVMDYKSNGLPDYGQESLTQAMREHNYGLQYWIYSLVLHQYLQNRLADYNYEEHFGGVKYLFVRGMNKEQENSAVYQTRPQWIKIQQLSAQLLPESE